MLRTLNAKIAIVSGEYSRIRMIFLCQTLKYNLINAKSRKFDDKVSWSYFNYFLFSSQISEIK